VRDKHLIPLLCWLVRAVLLLLKHIAQTRKGVVPPGFIAEGNGHYEQVRWMPDGDGDEYGETFGIPGAGPEVRR